MKLRDGVILHETNGEYLAVATGEAISRFNGLIRNNETSNFILKMLMTETTENEIVEAMCAEYDAPQDVISADVSRIVAQLKEVDLIE